MEHSENMTQKSDYQLNWIIANKLTYSENQIKAAFEEFKRREKENLKVEYIKITTTAISKNGKEKQTVGHRSTTSF